MHKPIFQSLFLSMLGVLFFFILTFASAGTINYWQGWFYCLVVGIELTVITVNIAIHNPKLFKRRMQMGREKEKTQKILVLLGTPLILAFLVLPPLDHRFGWSPVPWYLSILGDFLVFIGLYIYYIVTKENSFASSNVRVEKDQELIQTGTYGIIRHPMYAGALIYILGAPLALGSLWVMLITPVFFLFFAIRATEEEKLLRSELKGYKEYQNKVRWRLIPGIF